MAERNIITINLTRYTVVAGAGPIGPRGKSAYQSYVDTTADDPVLTEEEWAAAEGVTTAEMNAAITAAVDALIGGAPGALDTLNELAAALGDDASFASAVTTALAGKAPTSHNHSGHNLTPETVIATGNIGGSDNTSGFNFIFEANGALTGVVVITPPNASGGMALTADADGVPDAMKIGLITESTTARTLSATDFHKKVRYTNASGCAITVPNGIGVAGAIIAGRRATGAGALSFSLGGSVTVNNSGIASITAGQEFALMALSTNEYDFI